MSQTMYKQCHLKQGDKHTIGWIDSKGAHKGYRVSLDGEQGLWEVTSVGAYELNKGQIKDFQNKSRNAFPSINR